MRRPFAGRTVPYGSTGALSQPGQIGGIPLHPLETAPGTPSSLPADFPSEYPLAPEGALGIRNPPGDPGRYPKLGLVGPPPQVASATALGAPQTA
jgi:hypothetical protein